MSCEHPDWLPVGWKVSVKARSCGKKDKYYVNPSKGLKFNSKPEVLRYLESSGKDKKHEDREKIIVRKTVAGNLPPGWIKEIRTNRKGSKVRRDPCYIDPDSGRHFRSMQEVSRYLESKAFRKAKSKPDDVELGDHPPSASAEAKRDKSLTGLKLACGLKVAETKHVDMPAGNHLELTESDDSLALDLKLPLVKLVKQHAASKRKKLSENAANENVGGNKRLKSGSIGRAPEKADTPKAINVVEERGRANDSLAGNIPNQPLQVNENKQHKGGRRQSKRLADSKLKDNAAKDQPLQSGSEEGAEEKFINMPKTGGLKQREEKSSTGDQLHENSVSHKKTKNSNRKWMSDLPRRTSERLARVKVDPSLEVKTSHKAAPDASQLSGEAEDNTDTKEKFHEFNSSNKHPAKCRTENTTNKELKNPDANGNLSTLEEHKGVSLGDKEKQTHENHLDSALNDLLMDPCIEFAIKTLTGAIPIEDVNKASVSPISSQAPPNQASAPSSTLPSVDIWADPCFKFAVKTLIGEVPTDGGSQLQISFQQPVSSSGGGGCSSPALPKCRLDNIYPPNYSFSQCDAVKNPCMRQQGVRGSQNVFDTSLNHRGIEDQRRRNFS